MFVHFKSVYTTKVGKVFITRTYLSISALFNRELLYNRKNTHILLGLHSDYCVTPPSLVRSVQPGVVRPGPSDEHHQGQTRDTSRGDLSEVRPLVQNPYL
jgi:hypothetical protein